MVNIMDMQKSTLVYMDNILKYSRVIRREVHNLLSNDSVEYTVPNTSLANVL